MISKVASYLASLFLKTTKDDAEIQYQEVFQYVFFIIINYILFFGYSLMLGSLLGIPLQSIVFFILIAILRRYAGGYHANTETRCLIISTLYFSIGIVLIKLLYSGIIQININYIILTFICSLIILFLCPCDAPEKPLKKEQIREIRIKCIIIVIVYLFLILLLCFINKQNWGSPFIVCILIETILIIVGKIKINNS